MTETATPWYADHRQIAMLADYLTGEEDAELAEILDMLHKPWHYEEEHDRCLAYWQASRAVSEDATILRSM